MSNSVKIVIAVVAIVLVIAIAGVVIMVKGESQPIEITNTAVGGTQENKVGSGEIVSNPVSSEDVAVVPTMRDKISADSSWCGTFQLVWNDMKNEVVKKDVVFTPQETMVENLNKEEFTKDMLSSDYYFKIYGLKSLDLKKKIEDGIKKKFGQTSDILDDFDWSDNALDDPNNPEVSRYFFYAMLYRKFEFLKEFDKLENGTFSGKYNDVKYFGIDSKTDNEVGEQIDVLYYNSKDDFAVVVNTKTKDEVIFCKNPQGQTFAEIYQNMNQKAKSYTGSKTFEKIDEFKAPNLTFNQKREYKELEGKEFLTSQNDSAEIEKAIQSIKFTLDEKGGEIKSEAAIDMKVESALMPVEEEPEPRYFYVDDTFAIFLREKGKTVPYFAGRIEDISKFQ